MKTKPLIHALVTGATGGIGRGICFALVEQAAKDGAPIHISAAASKPGDRLDDLVDELRAAGAMASGVAGDITDAAQCAAIVGQAQAQGGDLSALVCNAGASGPGGWRTCLSRSGTAASTSMFAQPGCWPRRHIRSCSARVAASRPLLRCRA